MSQTVELDTCLTAKERDLFIKWFDKEIGTEYEINDVYVDNEPKCYNVVCFDIMPYEYAKLVVWEATNV